MVLAKMCRVLHGTAKDALYRLKGLLDAGYGRPGLIGNIARVLFHIFIAVVALSKTIFLPPMLR